MTIAVDLKRMRYVLEVARAETMTHAAETLGVTQSALSRQIADVELALGVELFERLPRGVRLTEAGERFVNGARRLLGDADNFIADVRASGDLVGGRLRIGVAPRGYINDASRALKLFAQAHPKVAIEVTTGAAETLCPALLNGEFDLMIGSSGYFRRWRELEIRRLRRLQFAIVVRPGHPLVLGPACPAEIDILAFPVILPETVEPIYSDLAQRYAHHGLPPFKPHYVVHGPRSIGRLLLATDAIHPCHSVGFADVSDNFTLLRDALDLPPHFIAIAFNPARARTAAAARFAAIVEQALAPAPPAAHESGSRQHSKPELDAAAAGG